MRNLKWKGIVYQKFIPEEFRNYVAGLKWPAWRPSFVVVHNTFIPNLADRPQGLTDQEILDLVSYYRDDEHWSAGPHLFVDDHFIHGFTPLTMPGVHSPSWNAVSWGVEMLGDFNVEDFCSGRGLAVQLNAIETFSTLHMAIGLDPLTMKLHHEDPKTTHKDCPGKTVVKEDLIKKVQDNIANRLLGEHLPIKRI